MWYRRKITGLDLYSGALFQLYYYGFLLGKRLLDSPLLSHLSFGVITTSLVFQKNFLQLGLTSDEKVEYFK